MSNIQFQVTKKTDRYNLDYKTYQAIWFKAKGDNVLLVNSDDYDVHPDALASITAFANQNIDNIVELSCFESTDYDGSLGGVIVAEIIPLIESNYDINI